LFSLRFKREADLDTPGNNLAELRMKASSEEMWMKAANSGAVIRFLLSEESSFMTGHTLAASGGRVMLP
jgi:hypothetical protein